MDNWTIYLVGFLIVFFACWSFSGYASSIGTLGGTAGEVGFPNIYARYINASFCTFTSVNIGLAGAGFFIAWIKSCASLIVSSVDENFGMLDFLGGNSTVSEIRSALVLGMYVL